MLLIPKKGKKTFDTNVNLQVSIWNIKMPWVRFIFNEVNLVPLVRCHDYTQIDKQKKVLVAK